MKNYIFRALLAAIVWIAAVGVQAQEFSKCGFELREFLKTVDAEYAVPLLVEGNENDLPQLVEQYNGKVRLQLQELFSIEIPAASVIDFSLHEAVKLIEFSRAEGKAMGDTMLIQINADSVMKQYSPLRHKYTGKGVVLGVIDSGVELAHPDFQDSTGRTRVMYVWDQGVVYNPNRKAGKYFYGVEWDSTSINAGLSTHDDKAAEFGHGSNVTGAAASNGLAKGNIKGVAPEVNIISVATDFRKPNWLQTVAEAVDYIYAKADSMGMPCVINASIGTYIGSHDGLDISARMIDRLIKEKEGRAFVGAAGNAAQIPFHLRHEPKNNDTLFTWFEHSNAQHSGLGGIYFEVWSDTNDFDNIHFAIGADKNNSGNYQFRGRTAFDSISTRLNVIYKDSVMSLSGNRLATIETYAEKSQGRYKLEVAIINPDSSDYLYRLESTGTGKLDVWSSFSLFRHNNMIKSNLPSKLTYPAISNYVAPDTLQTMVSSFTCLPSAITVGNYYNRNTYTDVSGTQRNMGITPGVISPNSSLGPNRQDYMKPDISSAGDFMFAAGRLATINSQIITSPFKVSQDSMHFRNGGTSMASPTVAGMVALYLEQCPNADYTQIKSDLLNSARSDQYAANLPNPQWGAGKADAFNFLKQRVFHPGTPIFTLNNLCEGDSLKISGADSSYSYHWNTDDTSLITTVLNSGDYYAWAENEFGCISSTDTAGVFFSPLPQKPSIVQRNDSLIASANTNGTYQWYFNQSQILGARDSIHRAQNLGDYYCIFTSNQGCSISTDTAAVLLIGIEEFNEKNVKLYPNPSAGVVNIQWSEGTTIQSLQLFSMRGKSVWQMHDISSKQLLELNWGHLSKGMYWLEIADQKHSYFEKVILE